MHAFLYGTVACVAHSGNDQFVHNVRVENVDNLGEKHKKRVSRCGKQFCGAPLTSADEAKERGSLPKGLQMIGF
jgi:hypothetical protein